MELFEENKFMQRSAVGVCKGHLLYSLLPSVYMPGVGVVVISLFILAKDVQLPPELRGFIFYAQVREEYIHSYRVWILQFILSRI